VNCLAARQSIDVGRAGAVAAEQSMFAQNPQVAGLCDCLVGGFGNFIGVGEAVLDVRAEQFVEIVGRKSDQIDVEIEVLEFEEFRRQQIKIPVGEITRLVIGDPIGLDLFWREANRHMHGRRFQG
jgi:hypothetical protein